jgi:hypothetical protein
MSKPRNIVALGGTPYAASGARSLSQIHFYPLSQFDGKMKIKDWTKLPHFPAPKSAGKGKGETKWVNPETFFDELPAVMKQVPPLPGEEALYQWISSVLEAADKLVSRFRVHLPTRSNS